MNNRNFLIFVFVNVFFSSKCFGISPFIQVSCINKDQGICNDTSVLKIYLKKYERECLKQHGIIELYQKCPQETSYLKSYCSIPNLNFQVYYKKNIFNDQRAKTHCQKQRIGAYALHWNQK